MYRDYGDKVDFYYMYKALEHPGINGFVSPYSMEERLKHISIAKKRINTDIPWLCDSMDNDLRASLGNAPNAEYVIDPDGKIIRKKFWSDPKLLRADLEQLVGKASSFTKPEDVDAGFNVEMVPKNVVASGVLPEIELPKRLRPIKAVPEDSEFPFFAKLRVEATPDINNGGGQLHFLLSLDPIYEMHWNNLAGKVRIELVDTAGMKLSSEILESDDVEPKADIDPRRFLVKLRNTAANQQRSSFIAKVSYHVCDNAETKCVDVQQEYRIVLEFDRNAGSRPGAFMIGMFQNIPGWDKNKDGVISIDELPVPHGELIMGHLDRSANGTIEKDEIEWFTQMFNNGNSIGRPDGSAEK